MNLTTGGFVRSRIRKYAGFIRRPMRFPTYRAAVRDAIETIPDDVRYAFLALAIERLRVERIEGAFAELGVYKGFTSKFIHEIDPARPFYLFDTFEGFPHQEIAESVGDNRFQNTSRESVARFIGNLDNIIFRPGFFPDTAKGLESVKFSLVMLDCDLYQPAVEGLRFFYPRLVEGGYFFLHDFNSPESDHAIARAASEFLADKPEAVLEIPDQWGSAVFRKQRGTT